MMKLKTMFNLGRVYFIKFTWAVCACHRCLILFVVYFLMGRSSSLKKKLCRIFRGDFGRSHDWNRSTIVPYKSALGKCTFTDFCFRRGKKRFIIYTKSWQNAMNGDFKLCQAQHTIAKKQQQTRMIKFHFIS